MWTTIECIDRSVSDVTNKNILSDAVFIGMETVVLALAHSFDGSQVHNSSKVSVWPHLFSYLTLPPSARCKPSSILMTSCSYFSSQAFFQLIAHELNMINQNGLCIFDASSGKLIKVNWRWELIVTHNLKLKIKLLTSMADLPAFAKAKQKAGSSSLHGACICSIEGVRTFRRTVRLGCFRFLPRAHPFRKKALIPKCLDLHSKSPSPTIWTKAQIIEAGLKITT